MFLRRWWSWQKSNFIRRLGNISRSANPKHSDLGFETKPVWLTKRYRLFVNNFEWSVCQPNFFVVHGYRYFLNYVLEYLQICNSWKDTLQICFTIEHFYLSYIYTIFRISRFCLKLAGLEIFSILRITFDVMFLNSCFTKSTEDKIWKKTRVK